MERKFRKSYKKFKGLRKRKSILRTRLFWDSFLVAFLAVLIFYLFFGSVFFKIKEIEISGPQDIPYKELQEIVEAEFQIPFLYFFQKDSFFLIDTKKIEENILQKYVTIKEANLRKHFPRTLILEIEKRKEAAVCCFNDNDCFLIDNRGVIFGVSASSFPEGLSAIFLAEEKKVNLGERAIPESKMAQILYLQEELDERLKIATQKLLLEGERLDIETTEGWQIYFDLSSDINLAMTKLKLVLEKEISLEERENLEYIDLRFSKVYYK